jgi:hypothetical protein
MVQWVTLILRFHYIIKYNPTKSIQRNRVIHVPGARWPDPAVHPCVSDVDDEGFQRLCDSITRQVLEDIFATRK